MIGSDPLSAEMSQINLASEALLSIGPPPMAPETLSAPDDMSNDQFDPSSNEQQELAYAKASWLDAMPVDQEYELSGEYLGIAAVNADENGLYRMFVGVSP